jgi:hypothetical protein
MNGTVTVSNLTGQILKATDINSSLTVINMQEIPAGIYLVTVNENGEQFTGKVMLD